MHLCYVFVASKYIVRSVIFPSAESGSVKRPAAAVLGSSAQTGRSVQIGDIISVIFERSSSKWVETKGHVVEWSEDSSTAFRAGVRPRAGADRTRAVHINEVLSLETSMHRKPDHGAFQVRCHLTTLPSEIFICNQLCFLFEGETSEINCPAPSGESSRRQK